MSVFARKVLQAWKLCLRAGLDLYKPEARDGLVRVPGWAALRLNEGEPVELLEALRALSLLSAETAAEAPDRVQLVATVLGRRPPSLLSTADVAENLLQSANDELLVVGYRLTSDRFQQHLLDALKRGVRIRIVGERQASLKELAALLSGFGSRCEVLHGVEPDPGVPFQIHAKVVVADRRRALVGSANFSKAGLNRNLEIGMQITGELPEGICRLMEGLVAGGWFEPVM